MRVTNLRCEYTENPLGIDAREPRLSWLFEDPERGQKQTAYQILVARRKELLDAERGDLWDSGKVASPLSAQAAYAGEALQSCTRYYWAVRVWDRDDQASAYSSPAFFETAFFDANDWQGAWISAGETAGPLLRKTFNVDKPVSKARLYICGVGYYEARLNGQKIGDHVLDPGWTDYAKTLLYTTFDVTHLLRRDGNALGILLGNGRFSPSDEEVKRTPQILKKYAPAPVVLAQLHIEFSDNTTMRILSDATWKTTSGPIQSSDIYDGERYDARLEKSGWDFSDYNDAGWQPAQIAKHPGGQLVSQATFPPVKISQTLPPQTLTIVSPGVYIYDFGQNFSGWVKLRVAGARGTKITIRYAELLYPDGTLNTVPNRTASATETYILKGEGQEVFEPRFTYHGFRYVEVSGFPGTPSLHALEGQVVHSALETAGSFLCSHPLLNQIHQNILWGLRSNFMSIPTDCPQRDERMGWLADAHLAAEAAIYNFDMAGFYAKWLRDIRDAQLDNGSVPDVVPMYWPIFPADPAWGTACLVIPWMVYQYYGDRRVLEENYPVMQRYLAFLNSLAHDDVLDFGRWGDWCPPWHVNSVDTPYELVSQWHYYHDTALMSQIAAILGKPAEADEYRKKAERIKTAFNRKFLHGSQYGGTPDRWYQRLIPKVATLDEAQVIEQHLADTFAVRSQTGPVLALYLNLVPEELKAAVVHGLVQDIIVMHGTHVNTGIIGTRYLFDVLSEHGHAELAYKLATQTTYPSWGYMIKEGATTLWERWEYLTDLGMNSQNHIMLGSIDAWFYRYLAGIQRDPSAPGWQHILIRPHVLGDLTFVSASLNTPKGLIAVSWRKQHDAFLLDVTIPVNASAAVSIPKRGWQQVSISESGVEIWRNGAIAHNLSGISSGQEQEHWVTYQVGSGVYCFEIREQQEQGK
ncbi:alpha-rhamnosidase [Candidatus Moduliflexus flocculans]|uniref:alpha-L-rhamnosidase n=1 Tax=Candidatus Moduliflexus flocculans TaxID=1499966 RepID=A0A0S6VRQ1_9BACT|nr:alpha-rhamnosidase [Candidatus Moduliflexus flocculans]